MSNNEYPEEIYICCENHGSLVDEIDYGGRQVKVMTEKAYDLGKKHAQADTGDWNNLTKAIAAGEPIDFEKLDGRKVRMSCETTSIEAKLSRDDEFFPWGANAWNLSNDNDVNHLWGFFDDAWRGKYGWTLWLDGEIPMRKQTAKDLGKGTIFIATSDVWDEKNIRLMKLWSGCLFLEGSNRFETCSVPSEQWEVVEVLGMYGQKESE